MATFNKKKKFLLVTAALLLTGGVAAAYWTTGGSGTGGATTATSENITVNQTSVVADMGPGVAPQGLSGTFTNDSPGTVYVTTVTASISGVTKAGGAVAGTCDATDYTLTNAVVTVGADIAVGDPSGTWGTTDTPLLSFNNKITNQDQCKLATVQLAYTIA